MPSAHASRLALNTGSIQQAHKYMVGVWMRADLRIVLFLMVRHHRAGTHALEDSGKAAWSAVAITLIGFVNTLDHQVLGGLVEHAASAGFRVPCRRANH